MIITRFLRLLSFELKMTFFNQGSVWVALMYFILSIMIVPFSLDSNLKYLHEFMPAFVWSSILPATLLGGIRLFVDDYEDGFIDRYALMNLNYEIIFLLKALVLMIGVLLPLIVILPLIGILFTIDSMTIFKLIIAFLTTAPAICFYAAFGSLLSVYTKVGYILTFIIVIPLIIPAVIFGCGILYGKQDIFSLIKLPLSFSMISVVISVIAGGYLYRQLLAYR